MLNRQFLELEAKPHRDIFTVISKHAEVLCLRKSANSMGANFFAIQLNISEIELS